MLEALWIVLILGFLGTIVVTPIVAIVLWLRVSHLADRVNELEQSLRTAQEPVFGEPEGQPIRAPAPDSQRVEELPKIPVAPRRAWREFNWENLLGGRALGWTAVVLLLFAAAFFLRYAFENEWIGPLGRVMLGLVAGMGLVLAGRRYDFRNWHAFSRILTAGGFVLLYLSTYASFGFYQLLPQQAAGLFLSAIVVESALVAVLYATPSLAVAALIGGLLTPVLMQSEQDRYRSLFTYLALLDGGIILLLWRRHWSIVGSIALLGTQALFWAWYFENYHPEKLAWALGFQAVLYVLFLVDSLLTQFVPGRAANWQDLMRVPLNAFLGFGAVYILLDPDYGEWMGTLAVLMAAVYVGMTRVLLTAERPISRMPLATLAVASGFLALAFPIQADAHWVALGWAAEAAALWWFGLRLRSAVLRSLGAVIASISVARLLIFDTPWDTRQPFTPLFNEYALPALGLVACLLAAVVATRWFIAELQPFERGLVAAASVVGVLLLWVVLSVETYGYFDAQAARSATDPRRWRWMGHMALSVLWAAFAGMVLVIGFWKRIALLRWTALGLFALTIAKVFVYDIAGLQEFYRILAFFIVAVLAGAAAWGYQRMEAALRSTDNSGERMHDHP